MKTPNHDLQSGTLTNCQICGSSNLELVTDLGHQALSDTMLNTEKLADPEVTYPSRFKRCVECSLGQIDHVVEAKTVFHAEYPYRTGITRELTTHQKGVAKDIVSKYKKEVRMIERKRRPSSAGLPKAEAPVDNLKKSKAGPAVKLFSRDELPGPVSRIVDNQQQIINTQMSDGGF